MTVYQHRIIFRTIVKATSGEAPPALLVEGVLNQRYKGKRSAAVSGEAPPALLVEGVLNPDNCR